MSDEINAVLDRIEEARRPSLGSGPSTPPLVEFPDNGDFSRSTQSSLSLCEIAALNADASGRNGAAIRTSEVRR